MRCSLLTTTKLLPVRKTEKSHLTSIFLQIPLQSQIFIMYTIIMHQYYIQTCCLQIKTKLTNLYVCIVVLPGRISRPKRPDEIFSFNRYTRVWSRMPSKFTPMIFSKVYHRFGYTRASSYRQTETTTRTARKFSTNMVRQISNSRLVRRRNEGPETIELSSKLTCGELFGSCI